MKTKTKTKSQNISIIIENNLFSKNKECKKKEYEEPADDEEGEGGRQPSLQYVAPFTPEPSFMSDIRQAFRDKNMYGFRYNTEPPQMYNPQGQPVYNHSISSSDFNEPPQQLQFTPPQQPPQQSVPDLISITMKEVKQRFPRSHIKLTQNGRLKKNSKAAKQLKKEGKYVVYDDDDDYD